MYEHMNSRNTSLAADATQDSKHTPIDALKAAEELVGGCDECGVGGKGEWVVGGDRGSQGNPGCEWTLLNLSTIFTLHDLPLFSVFELSELKVLLLLWVVY